MFIQSWNFYPHLQLKKLQPSLRYSLIEGKALSSRFSDDEGFNAGKRSRRETPLSQLRYLLQSTTPCRRGRIRWVTWFVMRYIKGGYLSFVSKLRRNRCFGSCVSSYLYADLLYMIWRGRYLRCLRYPTPFSPFVRKPCWRKREPTGDGLRLVYHV